MTDKRQAICDQITLDNLRVLLDANRRERDRLLAMLDAFRVKCPTCVCRLLPDEPCACCLPEIVWGKR